MRGLALRKSRGEDLAVFEPWQLAFIEELRVARLGTITETGEPHLVPVCYAFVEGRFAIAIDEKPKRRGELARVRNIRRSPRVSLLLDRYDDDWSQLAWVRIDGEGSVFERGDVWPSALVALRKRYPQYESMGLEQLPLISITPLRVSAWRWAD